MQPDVPEGFETIEELIAATETFRREALALAEQLRRAQDLYSPADFERWAWTGLGMDAATAHELAAFDGDLAALSDDAFAFFAKTIRDMGAQMS